jgi:hypothetical protein
LLGHQAKYAGPDISFISLLEVYVSPGPLVTIDKVKPSERYQALADDVREFLSLYRELWTVTPRVSWMEMPVGPNDILELVDASPEFQSLVDRTAQASGRAESAASLAGGLIQIGAGGPAVNPISNWRSSFNPIHSITRGVIEGYCNQLVGRLDQMAVDARLRERGLVGLVAGYLRIPSDVRDAMGPTASRAVQRGAFAAGVIVNVAAGLILAGLLFFLARIAAAIH